MNQIQAAFVWLNDPINWSGPNGILALTGEHLLMTALAVLLAAVVALPVGIVLGHVPGAERAASITVVLTNVSRALPTLALLTIFASTAIGFGNRPTILAAAIFALPVILANTYAGLRGVDADVRDAARGMGLSGWRVLGQVELPLALPLITAGLRTATVQVIATIPLAALVGGGGLGTIIVAGFGTQRYGQVLAGGVLVAALCLAVEGVLALAQRLLTPAPVLALQRS
ncbi:osmoprotectant transport system permease protein [Sanguibacter gelidistatuariae]|uniref:Osmoprotectant transport system permease protein n=1 Tax=Sanguibacter gelidistatuariae TaxID=1814289 RepID=A0A1G6H5H8_9MICO|nr:ABC transporter permease subunit [Sanguibacter gelidistatuariae]SDB89368.1 osmoprotectant transport system permease protein [Sanguibacter gelidistatuariae]